MDSTNKLEDSMLKIRFVIEEKHGFNKQTGGFYVKDQVCYCRETWIQQTGGFYVKDQVCY